MVETFRRLPSEKIEEAGVSNKDPFKNLDAEGTHAQINIHHGMMLGILAAQGVVEPKSKEADKLQEIMHSFATTLDTLMERERKLSKT